MSKNYIIAIGGTGSRCLEATIYLAAAGLFQKDLHVLILDPDQSNGNVERTKKLIPLYHQLYLCDQPRKASQRGLFGRSELDDQVVFRSALNFSDQHRAEQLRYFWQDPNVGDREFQDAIDYTNLSEGFKDFIKLFYEEEDLKMKLGKGYRGRPNVGAVTLISDLKRTANTKGKGLYEFINAIRADLKSEKPVRIFVFGSVFGGTGAAGLPTIPQLIQEIYKETTQPEKLRFGSAMLTPYFTFPKGINLNKDGPSPDSDIHQVATQAALLHYAYESPGYQHVYVIGAPELRETNPNHRAGGVGQENAAHFAEILSGLAARDFFLTEDFSREERHLHYANGDHFGWKTLPARSVADQREIKLKLLSLTTLAFLYRNILYQSLKDQQWYSNQAWYKDNFKKRGLSLESEGHTLDILKEFTEGYLAWLQMVGKPIRDDQDPPFNWSSLDVSGDSSQSYLGRLTRSEGNNEPQYAQNGYGHLMEELNRLIVVYEGKAHPVGLLIYLLHQATKKFCVSNYQLSR